MVQRNTEDLFRRVNSLIPDAIKASAYFDAQAKLMSSKLLDHSAASRAQDCGIPAIFGALAQIRVDLGPHVTHSSLCWRRFYE